MLAYIPNKHRNMSLHMCVLLIKVCTFCDVCMCAGACARVNVCVCACLCGGGFNRELALAASGYNTNVCEMGE